VAVAAVTVPTALNVVNVTVLLAAVVEKLVPVRISVGALMARFAVLVVRVGAATTVATCTAPVLPPATVTFAVKLPVEVGCVENVTVNCVAVAAVTVPTAPRLNATVLFAAVVEKFVPAMVNVGAFCARFAVLAVTVGAATTVAT